MSRIPHDLADEFPESAERLHALKMSNAHFAKLFEAYHEVNAHIHRLETHLEPPAEALETVLRRKRMMLKDEIYAGLKASYSKQPPEEG